MTRPDNPMVHSRRITLLGCTIALVLLAAACSDPPPPATVGTPPAASTSDPARQPPAAGPAVPPTRLVIPAMRLTAKVIAVGVDEAGEFQVPPSVDEIGWYRWGPGATATAGSIVIAGHVDSAAEGRGAFFRLRELKPGDRMTLTGADGQKREFTVASREQYEKTKIPLDRYFAREGPVRLTLITCGGPFDRSTRSYRDNVVVTAVPA